MVICLPPLVGLDTWRRGFICLIYLVYDVNYVTFYLFHLWCILGVNALVNIVVGLIAFRVNRKRNTAKVHPKTMQMSTNSSSHQNSATMAVVPQTTTQQGPNSTKKSFKITKMMLLVVGVFYLCWAPTLITTFIQTFPPKSWAGKGQPVWFVIIDNFARGLIAMNGFFNPIIYARRNTDFRKAFAKLLHL